MRKVNRSALVSYSAEQMFRLVEDVEAYPEFLPWCTDVQVHSRDENVVEASLELSRGQLRKYFRTRNTLSRFDSMSLELVGGPFRVLSGGWRFDALGDDGSKVTLELEFELENRALDLIIGTFFEETCNSMVDAFIERADQIYAEL